MRYHVIYQPGDVVYYTTNYSIVSQETQSADYLLNLPNSQVVTWQLNDLPLTIKFAENFLDSVYNGLHTKSLEIAYDVYREPSEHLLLQSRQRMNAIIDKFNSTSGIWFVIPESLKLDAININNVLQGNLNTLHDLFENNLPELYQLNDRGNLPEHIDFEQCYQDFQTINMLVHYNEKIFQFMGKDNEECRKKLKLIHKQYFTALKLINNVHNDNFYKLELQPDDYKHFTVHKPKGWLELDFATVGKDLVSCAWTNDLDLIKRNACSQQLYYYPWVSYGWMHFENSIHHRNNTDNVYNNWIKDNQVGRYIDLEDPKYTPGRHMLGQCISHDIDNAEDFRKTIIESTPMIAGICITDDTNKDIL